MTALETITRKKVRFATSKGQLSIEDLWDLPLTSTTGKPNLDDIARTLHNQINEGREPTFVESARTQRVDEVTQASFEVVLRIIEVRQAENKANLEAKAKAEQKQKILEILANRQDEALTKKTDTELQALLAGL